MAAAAGVDETAGCAGAMAVEGGAVDGDWVVTGAGAAEGANGTGVVTGWQPAMNRIREKAAVTRFSIVSSVP